MPSLSYCGINCLACSWRERQNCKTCKPYKGDIWHGTCEVAKCCINRGLEDCGQCVEFPCNLLIGLAFEAEYGDGGERIANLCRGGGARPHCGECCGSNCTRNDQEEGS